MEEKKCSACGCLKPFKEFYRNASRKDGRQSHCKQCKRKYDQSLAGRTVKHRYVHSAKGRATVRQYSHSAKRHISQRRYKISDRGRQRIRHSDTVYRRQYPERRKASITVNSAVRAGKLPRIRTQACLDCGAQAQIYHHESYISGRWLDVVPLCASCHHIRHELCRVATA